jgi:hypothetical protein
MSKGSAQRPRTIAQEEYEKRWDYIFGRDEHAPTPPKCWGESPNIDIRKVEDDKPTEQK